MPLQNRVRPDGQLVADPTRGLFMGNRGGRIHNPATRSLTRRRWTSKSWIICQTAFKDRHRIVWGQSYTELFFLDEVTALAAGHRPCFECRRADASAFLDAARPDMSPGDANIPWRAPDLDRALHSERLETTQSDTARQQIDDLPDGSMIRFDGAIWAVDGSALKHWTPNGYDITQCRPAAVPVTVLTPPTTLRALAQGYRPVWHLSRE
ncbi:MAG: hypothetical protein AAFX39_03960 [Pseudomonadota bacterium]